jgi:hypothetical protein
MADIGMGPARSKGIMLLAAIFILGMVCGAALFYMGQRSIGLPGAPPRPQEGPPPPAPLDHMSRMLDLDPGQREAIRHLLDEQRIRLEGFLEESRQEIRALLRPDQQRRFDDMRPPRPPQPGGPPPPRGAAPPHRLRGTPR